MLGLREESREKNQVDMPDAPNPVEQTIFDTLPAFRGEFPELLEEWKLGIHRVELLPLPELTAQKADALEVFYLAADTVHPLADNAREFPHVVRTPDASGKQGEELCPRPRAEKPVEGNTHLVLREYRADRGRARALVRRRWVKKRHKVNTGGYTCIMPSMLEGARPHGSNYAPEMPAPVRSHSGRANPVLVGEVADVVLCDSETSPVLCDTYLYEPDAGEQALGSLALLAETINLPSGGVEKFTARDILDNLAATIRNEYYRLPSRDMLASFEAALATANSALSRTAEQGGADWLMNLHVAVAAYADDLVHVSRVGSPSLLLIRNGKVTDIGDDLSDPAVRNPRAAFTNVASGTVTENDVVVLTGQNVFRIIPKDRLATLVSGKNPKEAATYTRDLILEATEAAPVAAVFLRFVRAPLTLPAPSSPPPELQEFTLPAAATLLATSRASDRGSGAPWSARARRSDRLAAFRMPVGRWRRAVASAQSVGRLIRYLATAYVVPTLTRTARGGARVARTAARQATEAATTASFRTSAGPPKETTAPSYSPARPADAGLAGTPRLGLLGNVTRAPRLIASLFADWPVSTKIFSASTVILAILFAGSLLRLRNKGIEDTNIRLASEQLQTARAQNSAAEAALIYGNTDEARRLLGEARTHMERVRQTPYYAAEISALLSTLEATEDKANQIVRIPSPASAGDFRSVAPDGRLAGLAVVGPQIFSFHTDTNAIFRLASDTGETSTVSQTSQGIGAFRQVLSLPGEQTLLLPTNAPGLVLFDTTRNELLKQELRPLPEGTKELRSVATFGSRLYVLLPEHRQVLGYSKALAGYQDGTPWVKDARVPVDRAVALGVDGYLYLLLSDGKIVKLLKGAPVDFAQSELSTPLRNPSRLFINETVKHLYVLDPPEKRVVVYDTTGKLVRQYVFPQAADLRELAIGGKEETLFVLDGTNVYRIPLTP